MTFFSNRLSLIAIISLAAVAMALISQHVFDMPPCAWCVFQRLIYLSIAALCIIFGAFSRLAPGLARVGGLLAALLAAGGMVAAWYQYKVASNMFSCDLTFADRFMVATGLDAKMPWLFGIYATCMDAKVKVLGVEYVLWSFALFAVLTLMSLWVALQARGRSA
jgi:disulfide bond formation protein DsbB